MEAVLKNFQLCTGSMLHWYQYLIFRVLIESSLCHHSRQETKWKLSHPNRQKHWIPVSESSRYAADIMSRAAAKYDSDSFIRSSGTASDVCNRGAAVAESYMT